MWTNVFKIVGLHQLSWFQFLPQESDDNSLPDKSVKSEQKDAAMLQVISAHLQLQKEGFFSTWTNSFVGPWDPSQGLHNPDEKIKLWLFLPERHSSVVETAQPAVSRLKVIASGLWLAPGDSEEVAAALSQALRNCIERALSGLSYVRFGDVFTKSHPSHSEEPLWRRQPVVEFIFAATEEAIFVHVIMSAKHIRALSSGDMEQLLTRSSNRSGYGLPVIVSPHGMRGWLTGCCPNDLVKQVYLRSRTSNGSIIQHYVSQGSGCQLRGQNCYVEVTIGCPRSESEKALQSNSNSIRNLPRYNVAESPVVGRGDQKVSPDHLLARERTFIYPAEAVVVPVLQTPFAKSSLKRFWLQNWIGPSLPGSSFFVHCAGNAVSMHGSWIETSGVHMECSYNSSSNSNSSSVSSISSSSSDSEYKMTTGSGDLEADADSLTCRKSGLSSSDQIENDSSKLGLKRPRASTAESFGQAGTVTNAHMQDAYKSDFGSGEVNNSDITGVANEQIGSHWDWDDDDKGIGMDIQALLSEFGDFGDFFENDVLPFGEPPGTAESQALMFPAPECGDVDGSPGMVDVSNQMLLPVGFPTFDNFNTPPAVTEECVSKNQEVENSGMSIAIDPIDCPPASLTSEFDHLIKAEALMTFAPEYGAVETPTSELSLSKFRNPYVPKSCKLESSNSSPNNYVYGATPPSSPCLDVSDEKTGTVVNPKICPGRHDANGIRQSGKYYIYVDSGKMKQDKKLFTNNGGTAASDGMATSALSTFNSTNAVNSIQSKISEGTSATEHILLSTKTVLATEVECIMFQASMCKMRHLLLSSSIPAPPSLSWLTGSTVLNQLAGDCSTMTDNVSSWYEVKKKESIPVRIAGDFDGVVQDGHLSAPVGVWRSVGVANVSKPTNSPSIEVIPSLPHHAFTEEGILSYQQTQHLMELLDGLPLLVQQATSFVDVALDTDCGDGPYGWLALQEQWRRGFSCGPSMVHAGCGGTLASCHSLDIAGVELIDPLSADIHPSSVISLLQSEIKTALKTAFGNLVGPLSVIDWCKGRSQSCDTPMTGDGSFAESNISEYRDSSSTFTSSVGEPMSPTQSSAGSSTLKVTSATDGSKVDETCQRRSSQEIELEQQLCCRLRPTLSVLPSPAILVGFQDDWLKTSACSLQHWEKAPLEPYAMQKRISYNVICPDIDPLISAATDFFQQLGTVYGTCRLGTHSPHSLGNQMEIDSGKLSSSGFVLLDCPRSMKIESSDASLVGSISDYLLSLSNGWDMTSYLKSLTKAIKALKIGQCLPTNPKEGISSPCMVIYVVCPFPEPNAVLQTVVASSIAVGSVILAPERERRSVLKSQVEKALSCSAAVDEALVSNVLALSGFSIPKLVLQIITVDAIFRVTTPALNDLVILKETAFTIYNKARRIPRGSSNDAIPSSLLSTRSHSVLTQMAPIPGMWKDCLGPRVTGTSLPREGQIDAGLRSGSWDNSWQTTRSMGSNCDPNRNGESVVHDEIRYMFEPLFILAEPGSLEHAVSPSALGNLASESSKPLVDDGSGGFIQSTGSAGTTDTGLGSQLDLPEPDGFGSGCQRTLASLHCCYGWTEDWRWLACVWTDARGELLDSHIFPFGGISSRQDTKGLQCLFVQILHQGCQILQACSSSDTDAAKPRDFMIARIGSFYELEYLEWQKAIYSVGGSDVKKWPLQLRRSVPDGMPANNNGSSLQQQDMSLIQDRTLPSSPNPLYSLHSKTSGFMKGVLGQPNTRKQLMGSHVVADNSRGMLQWVQSISFAAISMDHSLHLVLQADSLSSGIDGKSGAGGTQGVNGMGPSCYLEGFTPVKSLGSTSAAYMLIPSPSMRFLPPTPLQLPTCLTTESPPLAHLLHSKGFAIPLSTGFVVSKAVPSMRKDCRSNSREEWPSVLSVSLIDYYGSNNVPRDKLLRGVMKQGGRTPSSEAKDFEIETHFILKSIAAEIHALSWMTASPAYLERRTALPFHCDMVLRLRRLLDFAEKELSRQPDSSC
ncbi:mediator of RNA polymerase II transcription subunit 13 isoform X1 [Tripterygium wilfordii]|uniref:Mediator of RNA polymerase II transcription subunit 13 n=1 Tax=Tripterygium wilfordii TaxID=458696 RepID=A0A7J7CNM8_TRIWF|nr:mediator of RNA polymerase II transcription subunit 13-like isoform X2 [Tripterygium wilfordii]KAF5735695.1 mediator of RNA polymerase II transcription subunit 13 isoform X1 [Tripterygium wilfordii]